MVVQVLQKVNVCEQRNLPLRYPPVGDAWMMEYMYHEYNETWFKHVCVNILVDKA